MDSSNSQNQTIPVVSPQPTAPRRKHVGRWLTLALIALLIGAGAGLLAFRDNNTAVLAAPAATVNITSDGFVPATVKIKHGQSVTWVNESTGAHHVMANPYPTGDSFKLLNSGEPLASSETYTATFDRAGTFNYHDQLHPAELQGTVVVE